MARRKYNARFELPAPYLKRIWLDPSRILNRADYSFPDARLLRVTKYGLETVTLEQTDHFRLIQEFCADPATFIDTMLED